MLTTCDFGCRQNFDGGKKIKSNLTDRKSTSFFLNEQNSKVCQLWGNMESIVYFFENLFLRLGIHRVTIWFYPDFVQTTSR